MTQPLTGLGGGAASWSSAEDPAAPLNARDRAAWQQVDERIRHEFHDRDIVIDCPRAGCVGKFITDLREIHQPPGTGARIVLRCTRRPSDHEHSMLMPPFTPEERESLRSALLDGASLNCPRCQTPLALGRVDAPGVRGTEAELAASYSCDWCGVQWVPPGDVRNRVA